MLDKSFLVIGIDENDGSATVLQECQNSGEARLWLRSYVSSENAGGWHFVQVIDTRSECAETVFAWERNYD